MIDSDLPYQPIRFELYTGRTLYEGFDPTDPQSFARTVDFGIYRHVVMGGRAFPEDRFERMMQALHDQAVSGAVERAIKSKRVAAIMGGHVMLRGTAEYESVVRLSRALTETGILVCAGGGPGAMEASHLGALLVNESQQVLTDSLALLKTEPSVPNLLGIVNRVGDVDTDLVHAAHRWLKPAMQIVDSTRQPGESLAVPTWHYGHEPSTPFATKIAKYFQNSIREDGLLAVAGQGIVFAPGKAGTLQEIFQDAGQNYYRTFDHFSPMVLLDVNYWTSTLPAVPLLKSLFKPQDFERYVLVTDDIAEAARFIIEFDRKGTA